MTIHMSECLQGVLVVSLEHAVAAPFASCKLAGAGARVIKVERPGGDFARYYDTTVHGESAFFVWLNWGKESLVIDLRDREDAALMHRIIARADVYIQNLAPGAAERAGFGSAELRRAHPRLITCDISGYGDHGPYATMRAYDNLVQAEAGLIAVTGSPEAPARVGISICDISAGMHAYAAVLEALLVRERTGLGRAIHLSLFDCIAHWMAGPYLQQVYGGWVPDRSGLHHPMIAPYGAYRAAGGEQVIIAIQNDREWARFCEKVLCDLAIAHAEGFRTNIDRVQNRDRLNMVIGEVFQRFSVATLLELLRAANIAFARLNSVEEFANHPQLNLMTVSTAAGVSRLPKDPMLANGEDEELPKAVPALGEHTEAIRREFALTQPLVGIVE